MTCSNKFASLAAAFVAMTFLSSCGDAKAGMPTPAGGSRSVPGYGEGTGSSGQTSAAKFLYANPLPGGGPYAQSIQSNGTLTSAVAGSPNNVNPRTMAIDPSGSFVFQTAEGYNGGTQGGLFVYQINRSNGSLGQATSSYLTSQAVYSDVVDNQGKFLYVQAAQGVYGFSIQSGTGTLTQITGSPFAASGPSSPGYSQPATLMAVDQMNHFLYVSTTSGIAGFTINQTTGQLAPIAGSPFGAGVNGPWTIVVTPNNGFLYELESQNSSTLHGYSIDQNTGVLTALQGSPFSTGTCGSLVAPGTVGIPGPDNMTIATAGKFMYDNCGIYSLDPTTGTVAQVSSSGPGDWPVIDPTGNFLWAITSDQQSCFHCDIGVTTYQVDPNTGALTPVPNSFLLLTNSAVGSVDSLAITQ
jgi:6-phosphogluconolactonase (cycloisomerase 2 family)